MTASILLCSIALLSVASAFPSPTTTANNLPTIWVAGDSTTAPDGGHNGTQGWAEYLHYSFGNRVSVNNSAYAGRSARSFTREGRFDMIAKAMHPGDWIIIEFGINDGGSPTNGSTSTTGDKGRADCPGAGDETCTVIFNNTTEIVLTFPTYVKNASKTYLDLGAAGVIISQQLPTNVWQTGSYAYREPIFAYYDMCLGGPEKHVYFVQHGSYAAQAQKILGADIVDANYPMDNTHTSPLLADVVR
ncbi:carbohydrate esterase family 12 protein [Lophiostoma macrostomum CBS 122681]|uniref:Carbohydrate esterase family 12 protein n=1 Tax=Lophiostoma macrostomum CBS 122681 TaxID=1314788 RepID=A0A6A6SZU5_9PLEO|nr:carbohydrate esterase family 12 protein [Lophiostoma macrostomum CBS 122681]